MNTQFYVIAYTPEPGRFEQELTTQEALDNQYARVFSDKDKAIKYHAALIEMAEEDGCENPQYAVSFNTIMGA